MSAQEREELSYLSPHNLLEKREEELFVVDRHEAVDGFSVVPFVDVVLEDDVELALFLRESHAFINATVTLHYLVDRCVLDVQAEVAQQVVQLTLHIRVLALPTLRGEYHFTL